ncbi:unnamed protein product [Peniophora sp. CBMAI 1063]|nr:unnamed protein product [Peniophora sp. CBMAI 1063]
MHLEARQCNTSLGISITVLLLLLAYFGIHDPNGRASRSLSTRPARQLQNSLNWRTRMHRRPRCRWTAWHDARFAPLRNANRRVMIALLLHQNGDLISTLAQELPVVLEWVGVQNVYLSIFESGSSDGTVEYLRSLSQILDAIGVQHQIITHGEARQEIVEGPRRIAVLAAARNTALRPLYTGKAAAALGSGPDEVFFMNDIFFCAPDLLEMLLQYRRQGMHQACATDWGSHRLYDRWVLRTISGRGWWRLGDPTKEVFEPLLDDPVDRRRWDRHLPLQVFSCWNGASIIHASAFLPPHNIRFRQSKADWEDESGNVPSNLTVKASECFLSSVDLWKMGFKRIAIIPKASVAYTVDHYDAFRKDDESFAPKADDEVFEWVGNWQEAPPEYVVNQDYGRWGPPERWGPWDEQ